MRLLIGIPTHSGYVTRTDFFDYINDLQKPDDCMVMQCHDRSPARSRNDIFQEALNHKCTHVLLVDNDSAPQPDALLKLLEHDVDVVSGLYLNGNYPHPPICFDAALENGRYMHTVLRGGEQRLREVAAVGLGFCLIRTSILSRLEKPWVRLGEIDPQEWGDDLGFCTRVRQAGIKIHCDLGVLVGHIKSMIIWPRYKDGAWLTAYDTAGAGTPMVPQAVPPLPSQRPEAGGREICLTTRPGRHRPAHAHFREI